MSPSKMSRYKRSAAERREARAAYGFLAPAMALFLVFVAIPVVGGSVSQFHPVRHLSRSALGRVGQLPSP